MKTTARRALAAALLIPVVSLSAACGSDDADEKAGEELAEKMIESGSDGDVDVDVDDEKVSIETDEGKTTYGGTDRPESLPDDFPLADGEITNTVDSPDGAMVTIKVDGDRIEAFDESLATLEGQGWTRDMRSEAGTVLTATLTGENEGESVMISADSSTGEITYIVSLGG